MFEDIFDNETFKMESDKKDVLAVEESWDTGKEPAFWLNETPDSIWKNE